MMMKIMQEELDKLKNYYVNNKKTQFLKIRTEFFIFKCSLKYQIMNKKKYEVAMVVVKPAWNNPGVYGMR